MSEGVEGEAGVATARDFLLTPPEGVALLSWGVDVTNDERLRSLDRPREVAP